MKKILFVAIAAIALAGVANTTPVMVSLVTPAQVPSRSFDVVGFRLSLIYGQCRDFTGFDVGLINHATADFTGLGVGGVNITNGRMAGAQLGLVNWDTNADVYNRSAGLQLGLLNYSRAFCGFQCAFVNVLGGAVCGAQAAYANFASDVKGAQVGYYINVASGSVCGCQIGLVNYAATMDNGLQIGLVNIIHNNGWLPVLPIVNGHF